MTEKPAEHPETNLDVEDLDFAGELTDENNLVADVEFEQVLADAVRHRPKT